MNDKLGRNKLSALDVIRSNLFRRQSMKYTAQLHSELPILLLQGGKDSLMSAKACNNWFMNLTTSDKSLHRFPELGHLLVETPLISPDVGNTIGDWLLQRTGNALADKASKHVSATVKPLNH